MLLFTVVSVLLFAPALQGLWSFRTQFLLEAAVFLTGGFWLFRELLAGRVPVFLTDKRNIPLFCAAFCSLLAALLSPVRTLVLPEWWNFALGLFLLALSGSLSAGETRGTDLALRCSAWFMGLLALYQAFVLKNPEISASLTNPNALAFFTLLLLPLAVMWKDFFLLAVLTFVLIWTKSAAALLALSVAAGFYVSENMRAGEFKKRWPFLLVFAAAAGLAISQLDYRSFLDRLGWWHAALRMFADRPALGFGAGAFTYVYPAYHTAQTGGVATIYAHNYYLEFLAENGFFAFVFWFWAIALRFRDIAGLRKYAVIAALAHSVADFGLTVPANFFVFCYILGEQDPPATVKSGPSENRRIGRSAVIVAAAASLCCFLYLCGVFVTQLKLERLHEKALSAVSAGDHGGAEKLIETAALLAPGNPLVPELLGRIRMRQGLEQKDAGRMFSAAANLERAAAMNPYNAGAWRELERLYSEAGERRLLEGLRKRKAEIFKY